MKGPITNAITKSADFESVSPPPTPELSKFLSADLKPESLKRRHQITIKSPLSSSDRAQAYVRIVISLFAFALGITFENYESVYEFLNNVVIQYCIVVLAYAFGSMAVCYFFDDYFASHGTMNFCRRCTGIVFDLTFIGIGVYLAQGYGLILYPVFLTIILGYGFRFGLTYLFIAMVFGVFVAYILTTASPIFSQNKFLSYGLLCCMIVVPTYAASLLVKYQEMLRKLAETNRARSRFIANMSHELRTPLHAIIMNVEAAKIALGQGAVPSQLKPVMRSMHTIEQSSRHLKSLVDQVLDIASNEAGLFRLSEPASFDLYRQVRSVVDICADPNTQSDVKLYWHVDTETPRYIVSWEQHLREVLINTIGNAMKYTKHGLVSLSVEFIKENSTNSQSLLRFVVVDTGPGMTPKQRHQAFEPFTIGDDSRSREFGGTGLGLAITKQYVTSMNGTINLESTLGEGTCITIDLPVQIGSLPANETSADRISIVIVGERDNRLYETIQDAYPHVTFAAVREPEIDGADKAIASAAVVVLDLRSIRDPEACLARIKALDDSVLVASLCDEISVTPIEPEGSVFTLNNKSVVRDFGNLLALASSDTNSAEHGQQSSKRILVVDDNKTNLESAVLILEAMGHQVVSALSGSRGLKHLSHSDFDIAFIDLHMPGMSGLEMLKRYRASSPAKAVPIVMLTADATAESQIDAESMDVAAFLTKPIHATDLRLAIEEICAEPPTAFKNPSVRRRNAVEELLEDGVPESKVSQLLDQYLIDSNGIIASSCVAAQASDAKKLRQLLHKLIGSASAMRFSNLVEQLKKYERMSDAIICDEFPRGVARLLSVSVENTNELRSKLEGNEYAAA